MAATSWYPILVRAVIQALDDTFNGGFYADKVVNRVLKNNRQFGSRDRKFLAETVYEMVRWWGTLEAFDALAEKPLKAADFARRWVIYEAWKHDLDAATFVHEKLSEFKSQIPEFSEIKKTIENTRLTAAQEVSFPQWLYDKFLANYGEETRSVLNGLNKISKVYLRANALKITAGELLPRLEKEDIKASHVQNETLVLSDRKNVFTTKCFNEGLFEVQDLASQKIAYILNVKPGERVADVCAGAGGKTLHLAALMKNKGTLLAGDVSEKKLTELKTRAARAGVSNLRVQLFENSKDLKRQAENFDAVLIDAPCSGAGVICRKPDSKWKLSVEEIERLKILQVKVLDDYSKFVKPGGRLLYATCSLLREENEDQVEAFLKRNSAFKAVGESLHTRPDINDEDGFFAQLFQKSL
jgi:16S rRNA (cytosine967-C5)-methyltransferase